MDEHSDAEGLTKHKRSRSPSPGGYAKGRARKDEIVRTAMEAFAADGYRGTSVRDIARRVGLSQAGLVHHFGSKEALLAEVLRLRDEVNVSSYESGEPVEGISSLGRLARVAKHNSEVPGLVQLYVTLSGEAVAAKHPAHEYFVERYQKLRESVANDLRQAQGEGKLRTDISPEAAASVIIAVSDGLQVQWLLDQDTIELAEWFCHFLDDYVRGLSSTESAIDDPAAVNAQDLKPPTQGS